MILTWTWLPGSLDLSEKQSGKENENSHAPRVTPQSATGRPRTPVVPSGYSGAQTPVTQQRLSCQGNRVSLATLEHRPIAGPLRNGADTRPTAKPRASRTPGGPVHGPLHGAFYRCSPCPLSRGGSGMQPCSRGSSLRPSRPPSVARTVALVLGSRAPVWWVTRRADARPRCAVGACSRWTRPRIVCTTEAPDKALLSVCHPHMAHAYTGCSRDTECARPEPGTHSKGCTYV